MAGWLHMCFLFLLVNVVNRPLPILTVWFVTLSSLFFEVLVLVGSMVGRVSEFSCNFLLLTISFFLHGPQRQQNHPCQIISFFFSSE